MTLSELLTACRRRYDDVEVKYSYPSLYVICASDIFEGMSDEYRDDCFLEAVDMTIDELQALKAATGLDITLCTPKERPSLLQFLNESDAPQHWLPLFDARTRDGLKPASKPGVPAVHFYGFKGGQARSTVLAAFAKSLAALDYRVLVVDVDIEAPSLDQLFDVAAPEVSQTLMGLCGWSEDFSPVPVLGTSGKRGLIDLVPCRPRENNYDMDFAAFTTRCSLDLGVLDRGVRRLREIVERQSPKQYDLVLFDHRTGLAPSVLPVVRAWRGPTVVAVRPDGLSEQGTDAIASLFLQNPENPGAILCFSLDAEDTRNAVFSREPRMVQGLLEQLSYAINRGAEGNTADNTDEQLPDDALLGYWVSWFVDRAFLGDVSPPIERLSSINKDSLSQLREVLGFPGYRREEPTPETIKLTGASHITGSLSGASDAGYFVETPELSRLFLPSSTFSYVVGRKGTGKTRLYRELCERKLAEPMFAAADFSLGGMKSQGVLQRQLLQACKGDFKRFWWSLLAISLAVPDTGDVEAFNAKVEEFCVLSNEEALNRIAPAAIIALSSKGLPRRYLLVDGIETAVSSSQLRNFIEELLLFMLSIQSDSRIASAVLVRLFLRTDLLKNATQNIEQQTNHRRLDLRWNRDGIFNFVLSRIERIEWFNENFPAACAEIRERLPIIQSGLLGPDDYKRLLLLIFPEKLRRNNIQTLTFLETYFSDAGGDSQEDASFYPRLFETFLAHVQTAAVRRGATALDNGRVSHLVVLDAHAGATDAFVGEVTYELYGFLEFNESESLNREKVDELLAALEGKPTPFNVELLVSDLASIIPDVEANQVRQALQRMREVGIFESRPGYPGFWRAGRLYKSALRMKYVR